MNEKYISVSVKRDLYDKAKGYGFNIASLCNNALLESIDLFECGRIYTGEDNGCEDNREIPREFIEDK